MPESEYIARVWINANYVKIWMGWQGLSKCHIMSEPEWVDKVSELMPTMSESEGADRVSE